MTKDEKRKAMEQHLRKQFHIVLDEDLIYENPSDEQRRELRKDFEANLESLIEFELQQEEAEAVLADYSRRRIPMTYADAARKIVETVNDVVDVEDDYGADALFDLIKAMFEIDANAAQSLYEMTRFYLKQEAEHGRVRESIFVEIPATYRSAEVEVFDEPTRKPR